MPNPDLEIRGGQSSRTFDKGGGSPKKIFSALWASVWSKNRRGSRPLGPSPGSATRWSSCVQCTTLNRTMESTAGRIQPSWHSEQIFPSLYMAAVIN